MQLYLVCIAGTSRIQSTSREGQQPPPPLAGWGWVQENITAPVPVPVRPVPVQAPALATTEVGSREDEEHQSNLGMVVEAEEQPEHGGPPLDMSMVVEEETEEHPDLSFVYDLESEESLESQSGVVMSQAKEEDLDLDDWLRKLDDASNHEDEDLIFMDERDESRSLPPTSPPGSQSQNQSQSQSQSQGESSDDDSLSSQDEEREDAGEQEEEEGEDPWVFRRERLTEGDDQELIKKLGRFFTKMLQKMSKESMQKVYDIMLLHAEDICRAKRRGSVLKTSKAVMERMRKEVAPPVFTSVYKYNEEGKPFLVETVDRLRKDLQTADVIKRVSRVPMANVMKHVARVHGLDPNHYPKSWKKMELCSDDVDPSKGGSFGFHTLMLTPAQCGVPLPLVIHQVKKKSDVTLGEFAEIPLEEFRRHNLRAASWCCDSKERKWLQGMVPCNGYYSCSICEVVGKYQAGRVTFPVSDRGRKRTERRVVEQAEEKRRGDKHRRGVVERSPLWDLPGLHVIRSMSLDSMHNRALGLTKKWEKLILQGPTLRTSSDHALRHLEKLHQAATVKSLNSLLLHLKVPHEFYRRPREVTEKYKASEWRLLGELYEG